MVCGLRATDVHQSLERHYAPSSLSCGGCGCRLALQYIYGYSDTIITTRIQRISGQLSAIGERCVLSSVM